MDQQLEQYEQNLKAFFTKVRAMLFVGLAVQHRWAITAIVLYIGYWTAIDLYYQSRFVIFNFTNLGITDDALFMAVIGLWVLIRPVLFMIGVLLAPFGKKWGWIGLCLYAFNAVLVEVLNIISKTRLGTFNGESGILGLMDETFFPESYLNLIFWLALALIVTRYLLSKPVEAYYKVDKRAWLIPFGITIGIILIELLVVFVFSDDWL